MSFLASITMTAKRARSPFSHEKETSKRPRKSSTCEAITVTQYEKKVKGFQVKDFDYSYYMHGIIEEAGEVFEAIRAGDTTNVIYELGDVLWYIVSFSMKIGEGLELAPTWNETTQTHNEVEVFS